MSRMRMGQVAGVSLALLLGAATIAEAQVEKRRPGVPPVIGRQPAAGQQPAGPPGSAVVTQVPNILLPCCVVQGVEKDLSPSRVGKAIPDRVGLKGMGNFLVVKHTNTGKVERLRVSGASSAKYRPGQLVDMSLDKTRMAVTVFPVLAEKESKIKGKTSWKMWTDVTVSNNGRIDGKTRIKSSEAVRGFTGGMEYLLTDRAGNILYHSRLRKWGVDGEAEPGSDNDRTVRWDDAVTPQVLNKMRAVVIHHSYEPKVRLAAGLSWIRDNWDEIYTIYKCTVKYLGEDEEQTEAPPPPPGQNQTQPPVTEPSGLECLEAGEHLAEEGGM